MTGRPVVSAPTDETAREIEAGRRLALQDDIEALRAAAFRVEYAWENLRGWMPNGRGVRNWTREMNDAVGSLEALARREARDGG